jgi:hypothetical protein
MWIIRENKIMVEQLLVSPVQPQVENNARACWFIISAPKESLLWSAVEQFLVGADAIRITDNGPSPDGFSISGQHTNCSVVLHNYLPNCGVCSNLNTKTQRKFRESFGNCARAAARVPDTVI